LPSAAANSSDAAPRQGAASLLVADLAQAVRASALPPPVLSALLQALGLPEAAAASPLTNATLPEPIAAPAEPTSAVVPTLPAQANTVPAALRAALPTVEQALQAVLDAAVPSELTIAVPAATATATPVATSPAAPTLPTEPALALADIESSKPSVEPASLLSTDAARVEPQAAATAPAAANAAAASILSALPTSIDPKEVMLVFQQVLDAWSKDAPAKSSTTTPAAEAAPSTSPAAAAPGDPPTAAKAPPPPYRGGPTTPQPSVQSALPLNADTVTVVTRLMRETNAAIAHQELLQLASLPPGTQGAPPSDAQNPQWMFEIPFATPQGSAVAQFKISRDGGGKGSKGVQTPVWRAQFSLDIEPMGPVHAQIVLAGDRTWVSLWAERDDGVQRLRQHEALLATALTDANFVAEIAFHAGAPRQPATNAGRFLDHAS
jgi:hypothetical protein